MRRPQITGRSHENQSCRDSERHQDCGWSNIAALWIHRSHLFSVTKSFYEICHETGSNRFLYMQQQAPSTISIYAPGRYLEEYNELAREHNQFLARMRRWRQPVENPGRDVCHSEARCVPRNPSFCCIHTKRDSSLRFGMTTKDFFRKLLAVASSMCFGMCF